MNKKLWFLFLTIFLDMLGIGIIIPVMPMLLGEPSSIYYMLAPEQRDLGYMLLGLLATSYPLALFFTSPVLGALSDKYGRKPVLSISLLGTSIAYFIFAWAIIIKNIPLLFISRIVDGMTGGNISVAQAAIADLSTPEDRAKVYGMMGAVFGAGFIFGPFLGGVLSSPGISPYFSASTPFIFSGILALINTFLIKFLFKESIKEKHTDRKLDFLASLKNISKAKKFHDVRYLFLTSFFFNAGFAFFTTFFNVYLTNKFGFSSAQVGNFFAYVGVWIIITQLLIVRKISEKFSETRLLGPAYLASAVGILLYLFPDKAWYLLLVVPLASIPNGIQQANFTSLLSKRADESVRGEVMGINTSVNSLGQALPPIFAGAIAAATASFVPIIISSLIVFLGGIIFIYKVKRAEAK